MKRVSALKKHSYGQRQRVPGGDTYLVRDEHASLLARIGLVKIEPDEVVKRDLNAEERGSRRKYKRRDMQAEEQAVMEATPPAAPPDEVG